MHSVQSANDRAGSLSAKPKFRLRSHFKVKTYVKEISLFNLKASIKLRLCTIFQELLNSEQIHGNGCRMRSLL